MERMTEGILQPLATDVLSGRGGKVTRHPGNINYQNIIKENRSLYLTAKKADKLSISESLVRKIRLQHDARFLLRDQSTKLWHEIGQPKAVEKTSQALREGLSKMRKKPVKQKKKITILNDEKDTIDSIKKEGSLLNKCLAKEEGNDKSRNEGSSPNDEPVESDVLLKKYKKFIFSMEHSLTEDAAMESYQLQCVQKKSQPSLHSLKEVKSKPRKESEKITRTKGSSLPAYMFKLPPPPISLVSKMDEEMEDDTEDEIMENSTFEEDTLTYQLGGFIDKDRPENNSPLRDAMQKKSFYTENKGTYQIKRKTQSVSGGDELDIDSTHLSKVSNAQALSAKTSSDYNEYSFPTFNSGITQEKNIVNMNNENYDNGQSIRNVGTNSTLQPTEISSHKSSYDDLLKQALRYNKTIENYDRLLEQSSSSNNRRKKRSLYPAIPSYPLLPSSFSSMKPTKEKRYDYCNFQTNKSVKQSLYAKEPSPSSISNDDFHYSFNHPSFLCSDELQTDKVRKFCTGNKNEDANLNIVTVSPRSFYKSNTSSTGSFISSIELDGISGTSSKQETDSFSCTSIEAALDVLSRPSGELSRCSSLCSHITATSGNPSKSDNFSGGLSRCSSLCSCSDSLK